VAGIGCCTATLVVDPMAAGDAEIGEAADAAIGAGYADLSVWAHQLGAVGGAAKVAVVEAAMGWANAPAEAAAREAANLAGLVTSTGATKLVAVCLEPAIDDVESARRNLAALVDAVDAQVCVEFLPWSGIPDLATAWSLVEPTGAGVLLDTWHWQRQPGGPAPDLLRTIPGERIGYVQLCDAAAEPVGDLYTEAMHHRLPPGEGIVDFATLKAVLDEIGADPYVATEIFNPELVEQQGPHGAAMAMLDAARSVWR
jgi:sugar phosphate isomerase/epimerase